MKYLRILLTVGFASMLFAGAAQAGEGKKEGKACCECCKGTCDTAKKADKKP